MKPQSIPVQLLTYLYPGASGEYWRLLAKAGKLGPLTNEPGKTRNRLCATAEIELRYGERTEDQYAAAIRAFETDHCITRRVAP